MDLYNNDSVVLLSKEPDNLDTYNSWIEQDDVIPFLNKEIEDDHIIIYASLPHVFIHTVLMPDFELTDSIVLDLLRWSHNPYTAWGIACTNEDVWIEGPLANAGSKELRKGEQIIFVRSFEGDKSKGNYIELDQKISHLLDIHFIPEQNAWCKLDKSGDLEEVVKIIKIKDLPKNETGIIVTIKKDTLSEYTSVSNQSLFRMFDFARYKTGNFIGWTNRNEPIEFNGKNEIFGSLTISHGYGSYSRGFQIKSISVSKEKLIKNMWFNQDSDDQKKYETFIAQDWKHNNKICEISCNPKCLANYFTESELPFEITPVFFKPEVLLRYKSDREKYQLESRSISCRGTWHLKTFDINKAGQVHTYLIYLSYLPYEEQLFWKAHNENPKAPLSERAIITDFEGKFYDGDESLIKLKNNLDKLHRSNVSWWKLRDKNAPDKVHYPYTSSKDEWAEEIMNLDQLVVEGLEETWLRKKAKELGRTLVDKLRALKLVEECLIAQGFEIDHAHNIMSSFHNIHTLRSILKGHTSGSEAEKARKEVLQKHRSFRAHYENLCLECNDSLEIVMESFKDF